MNFFKYLLFVLSCIVLTACGIRSNKHKDNTIVVSIAPLKYIVEAITDGDFPISILVPEGSSPETYSPTPSQILETESAKLIFFTGLIDFEKELSMRIDKTLKNNNIIDLSEGVSFIEGECSHDDNETHHGHHHGVDPHIWTSPKQLKIMADNVYKTVCEVFPDSLSKYTAQYQGLILKIDEVDRYVKKSIDESHTVYFMVYHPALTYYAHDYGLEQISIENEGKEPSVTHMREVVNIARKYGINTIMYQREFSKSVVESTAREAGAHIVEINPLNEDILNEIIAITNVITSVN